MKGSNKKLEATLYPTVWAELLPRMPKKKEQTRVQDYSFRVDEKKNVAIMDFRSFNNPQRMKIIRW